MHAESFSSPSVNRVYLESIQERGRGRAECLLQFSDGASFCIPTDYALQLSLSEGDFFTEEERDLLHHNAELLAAYRKGMELAARSEHCRAALQRKLEQRGFTAEVAGLTVDRLSTEGAVDDRRFAEMWAASRLRRRPSARNYILAELRSRGVDGVDADAALDCIADTDPSLLDQACLRATTKLSGRYHNEQGLIQALRKRGFSVAEIRASLDELLHSE